MCVCAISKTTKKQECESFLFDLSWKTAVTSNHANVGWLWEWRYVMYRYCVPNRLEYGVNGIDQTTTMAGFYESVNCYLLQLIEWTVFNVYSVVDERGTFGNILKI